MIAYRCHIIHKGSITKKCKQTHFYTMSLFFSLLQTHGLKIKIKKAKHFFKPTPLFKKRKSKGSTQTPHLTSPALKQQLQHTPFIKLIINAISLSAFFRQALTSLYVIRESGCLKFCTVHPKKHLSLVLPPHSHKLACHSLCCLQLRI